MADGAALLRMLEPTVRPVQTPANRGDASRETSAPARPFEALLSEASQASGSFSPLPDEAASEAAADGEATKPVADDPLSSLSRLDRVENASLRRLMA